MLENDDLSETEEASKPMQNLSCSLVGTYFTASLAGWLHNSTLNWYKHNDETLQTGTNGTKLPTGMGMQGVTPQTGTEQDNLGEKGSPSCWPEHPVVLYTRFSIVPLDAYSGSVPTPYWEGRGSRSKVQR